MAFFRTFFTFLLLAPFAFHYTESFPLYHNDDFGSSEESLESVPKSFSSKLEEVAKTTKFRSINARQCNLQVESGTSPCAEKSTVSFHYDMETGKCKEFTHSGCGGNANRYSSAEDCAMSCMNESKATLFQPKNSQCNWAVDVGLCFDYLPMYYYDIELGKCMPFVYGGCLGNSNRFSSVEECETFCIKLPMDDPYDEDEAEEMKMVGEQLADIILSLFQSIIVSTGGNDDELWDY